MHVFVDDYFSARMIDDARGALRVDIDQIRKDHVITCFQLNFWALAPIIQG